MKPEYNSIYDNQPKSTEDELKEFMLRHDSYLMYGIWYQSEVQVHKNMFVPNTELEINSVVEDPDVSPAIFNQIQSRLRHQSELIQGILDRRDDMKRHLLILRVVANLIPLFTAMKKSGKIVNFERLLTLANFGGSDELRTEKEFPPHIVGKNFKCKNFDFGEEYFGFHGRMGFDVETKQLGPAECSLVENYDVMIAQARENLDSLIANMHVFSENYPVPLFEIEGTKYSMILLETEPFSSSGSMRPLWVKEMLEEESRMIERSSTIRDGEVKEFFKRKYGFKKAMKLMIPFNGVRIAAELGLITATQVFIETGGSSLLLKEDEKGMSLIHTASIKNQVSVVTYLLNKGADVDVRRFQHFSKQFGATPLHFACKHGSVDVVDCLLSSRAKTTIKNPVGWFAVHCATFYDHPLILLRLIRRDSTLLDITTQNKLKETPLHLAACSGALKSTKLLINNGATVTAKNSKSDNVVHLAALNTHNNIIKFYVEQNFPELPVWDLLVAMLHEEDNERIAAALKSLEFLSTAEDFYWKSILKSQAIPALVKQLHSRNLDIVALTCSIINNVSFHEETRVELTKSNSIPILITLLGCKEPDIQSRSAIIQTDLADLSKSVSDEMREKGAIEKMFDVLEEGTIEDVLINVMSLTIPLCKNNPENQSLIMEYRMDMIHMELLTTNSDDLRCAAARSISAVVRNHYENQCTLVYTGILIPLIELMKTRNLHVQITGAGALEALATNNPVTQALILEHRAHVPLMKLLKVWSIQVKEQAAYALWALAGQALLQQKTIARTIGIPQMIDMILLPSDKLKYIGCLCLEAYSRNDVTTQNELVRQNAISPLSRLLRTPKITRDVQLMCIKAIGSLCVGVANRNNVLTQAKLAEEECIAQVLKRLLDETQDRETRVNSGLTLAKLVLNNSQNLETLREDKKFKYKTVLEFLDDPNICVCLTAGMAVATFAFNSTKQQYSLKEAGGVSINQFSIFLKDSNEYYQACGAFLITVLAKVIFDVDEITLTSRAVNMLAQLLFSQSDETKIATSSFMASLCHMRAGIPQALVTLGVIEQTVKNLQSTSQIEVKRASANALGYLTFNALASRILLATCRARPMLFHTLMENLETDAKINEEFVKNFDMEMEAGCPMHHLEVMGGTPIKEKLDYSRVSSSRPITRGSLSAKSRPTTSSSQTTKTRSSNYSRVQSALKAHTASTPVPGPGIVRPMTSASTSKRTALNKSVKISADL